MDENSGVRLSRLTSLTDYRRAKIKTMIMVDTNEIATDLSLIYNATSDGMLLISLEGDRYRIAAANQTFLEKYDIKKSQVTGKFLDEVASSENNKLVAQHYQEVMKTKEPAKWEAEFELPSGTVIGEITATPAIDGKGMFTGLVLTIHDITERKWAEKALAMAEARFRNLVEQSMIGVYIIEGGIFRYVNPHLAGIFGFTQSELIGMSPATIIHRDDLDIVSQNIASRVNGSLDRVHYEAKGMHRNGNIVYLEIFCSGKLEMEGNAIIGTVLDISKRKLAEKEREKALFMVNERMKELTLLNKISDILQHDNRKVDDVISEIVQLIPEAFKYPDKAAARIVLGEKEFATKNYGKAIHSVSSSFSVFDGESGLVEVLYPGFDPRNDPTPIFEEERTLVGMVAEMISSHLFRLGEHEARKKIEEEVVNQKIKQQKRIARAILTAQETERNKIGQELHDNVNQILASAKIYLGLAKDRSDESVRPAVENSLRLVSQAIEEIRALSSTQVAPVKKLNLIELIKELIEKLEDSTSIRAKFDYEVAPGTEVPVELKLNIYRIIQEQISNILKHSDATMVHVNLNFDGKHLKVITHDNGQGFDPDQKRNGIGISNIINRVESFNGQINIESSPGSGVTTYIVLPVEEGL